MIRQTMPAMTATAVPSTYLVGGLPLCLAASNAAS